MSEQLIATIARVVRHELARQRPTLLGVVTAVFAHEAEDDNNNYEANVRLKNEDLELLRVPMLVEQMGTAKPPHVGDLVLLHFINGDLNQPVIAGRFYHNDERPPLHREDDSLFEHRLPDGTLNHLRFASDGSIFIQRDVANAEDNSDAAAGIKLEANGNIVIHSGTEISITLTKGGDITITADGLPLNVNCDSATLNLDRNITINGEAEINGNATINGDLTVSGSGGSTTISGTTITGA
jgi:phage baseplate assembly protein gpV